MWLIKPKKLFQIGLNGFYIAAKLDRTVWQHIIFGLFIGVLHGIFAFHCLSLMGMTMFLTKEVVDSWGYEEFVGIGKCKQGFDILDFSGGMLGIIIGFILINFLWGIF